MGSAPGAPHGWRGAALTTGHPPEPQVASEPECACTAYVELGRAIDADIAARLRVLEVAELVDRRHGQGTPLLCRASDHGKTQPVATTLPLGGAPWCGECSP
jgi:hypothetical protein